MILSLGGKAQSWASQTFGGKVKELTPEDLIKLLKKRFGSQKNSDITLGKFLNMGIPNSREEYSEMLK